MGSKPAREDETPSAGINWKLFLLVAGIIGIIAFFAGMAMQGDSANLADVDSPSGNIGYGKVTQLKTVEMPKEWVFKEELLRNGIPLETGKLYIGEYGDEDEKMGMFILKTYQHAEGEVTRFSYDGEEISLVVSSSNIPYKAGTFEMFKSSHVFLSDTVFKGENVVGQNSENANYVCVMFEII